MATSGTYTFSMTRDELLKTSLQMINIIDVMDTPTSDQIAVADRLLNMMLKFWSHQGVRLWRRRLGYLFTAYNQSSYSLGTSGDHATKTYVTTDLSVAKAAAATSLSVDSTTGMTVGDYIGIELDDGTRQWTTIATIPTSTTLTISAGLTSAAAIDNTVITYTTKLPRPLRIIRGTTLDLKSDNTETTMQSIGFDEYFNMPQKSTGDVPNNFYYDKSTILGTLYLFPTPKDVSKIVTFTYLEQIQDTGDSTDQIDIPDEWLLPVAWNLAVQLAYFYGDFPALDKVEPMARELFETVKWYDTDDEALKLGSKDYAY